MGAKTRSILVRGARELLTLRGVKRPRRGSGLSDLGIITDGSLLIRDGIVVEAGSARRVENLAAARGAIEINATGRVVMPGFVDCHTHLVFPPPHDRVQREDALRANHAGTTRLLQSVARGWLDAMARHGTTTAEVKTGCYPDLSAELKLLRLLLASQGAPLDIVPTFLFSLPSGAGTDYVDRLCRDFLPAIRRRRMIQFADLAWEEGSAAERFLASARSLGVPRRIHAAGSASGAVEAAIRYQAHSVDHVETASARDADLLAGSPTIATLLPGASLSRNSGFAPARMLIDRGAGVALASDFSPRQVSTLSMQMVIRLACMHLRMTTEEAITAATINAAYAAGRGDETGSLEPGKLADLVVLNVSDYRELATYFGVNLVCLTMKRGAVLYQESRISPGP